MYIHGSHDRMVAVSITTYIQSVPVTTHVVSSNLAQDLSHTYVVSSNPSHGNVYSIQHYVIKFVSDLLKVGGFLRFPLPIKLTATI
jgi:hypothetical protein